MTATTSTLQFYLNGKSVTIESPSPSMLLVDYLRSPEVRLTGTKKPCGQGGCGGCTVILSDWPDGGLIRHRAINSCLRRLCSLNGMAITTIEGTGSLAASLAAYPAHHPTASRGGPDFHDSLPSSLIEAVRQVKASNKGDLALAAGPDISQINPVAHALSSNNGSQCGYCSAGFVMNMSEFITNNPQATKQDIEDIFDGNLCRCTGYRPILTGMKTMASDWNSEDEDSRMKCLEDPEIDIPKGTPVKIDAPASPFPVEPLDVPGSVQWFTPSNMDELAADAADLTNSGKTFRFIHGGTSYGVYKTEFETVDAFIDLRYVQELQGKPSPAFHDQLDYTLPAATTYSELIEFITNLDDDSPDFAAILYMAKRTAGRIVRNAASIGGNFMLWLHHIANGSGEPFPSDLTLALIGTNMTITYYELDLVNRVPGQQSTEQVDTLLAKIQTDPTFPSRIVVVSFQITPARTSITDLYERYHSFAQKAALREVNSHSIVNSFISFDVDTQSGTLDSPSKIIFGGINASYWRASAIENSFSTGSIFSYENLLSACAQLKADVTQALADSAARRSEAPWEGFTDEYKANLAVAMLYKAGVAVFVKLGFAMPVNANSAGEMTWGTWPVSDGRQDYTAQNFKAPVGQPYVKTTALEQCSGRTNYTHELAYPQGTLHAAFVQSRNALARFSFQWEGYGIQPGDLNDKLADMFPHFRRLLTCEDVPVRPANFQGMGGDQPMFAEGSVLYFGQAIAMVLADTEEDANLIADYVSEHCLGYQPINWDANWQEPILTIEDAITKESIFPDTPSTAAYLCHIWKVTRLRSRFDWMASQPAIPSDFDAEPVTTDNVPVDGANCIRVVNNQKTGGQAHFYMETQACLAIPADDGRIIVNSSTQSPMEMHQTVASALGRQYNKVKIQTRLLGGAFGGKTEQARFTTGPTAVAAAVMDAPVRLAMARDSDMTMIGKRHALYGVGQIAVDDGSARPEDRGRIKGTHLTLWADGGAYYDCSFVVTNCIQTRIDNAYMIDNFESQIDACRTNTPPNTAMRAFGDVQATNILENLIDDAATALGLRPEDLREKNFYQRGEVTPYGQTLTACYMLEVWNYLKAKCQFEYKLMDVQAYNAQNKWRKRGIALIPVKYGSGYNFEQLKQSPAIVVVNQSDGSLVIHQGGVDMGQGLLTQARQVAAYVLNIPQSLIHVESPQTDTTPNTSSTGASTGTPYSAEAVKRTCEQLRQELTEFGYRLLKDNGNDWCQAHGFDFWNYGEAGWNTEVTINNNTALIWQNLVNYAYVQRLPLTATFNANIEHGDFDMPVLTFKQAGDQPNIPGITRANVPTVTDVQNQFVGFTYSAACSVVEVDILTGETKILSSDVVYDVGWSLNPALDVGQVEGAFVQGIGFLMTEDLVYQPETNAGNEKGQLNTTNTWRYKIPAQVTIPLEFNVSLFPRNDPSVVNIPPDDQGIFSAKEVGEPPLVLANSVFFAIKDAIRASRVERGLSGLFNLRAPATVQEVRCACAVDLPS